MRFGFVIAIWMAGVAPALAAGALDDPLPPAMADPRPNQGAQFSAATSTMGAAVASPERVSAATDNKGCSALNPCAIPTPAASRAAADKPARP